MRKPTASDADPERLSEEQCVKELNDRSVDFTYKSPTTTRVTMKAYGFGINDVIKEKVSAPISEIIIVVLLPNLSARKPRKNPEATIPARRLLAIIDFNILPVSHSQDVRTIT